MSVDFERAALHAVAAGDEIRTWSSASGEFTVEAKFVELDESSSENVVAVLENRDGRRIRVPLEQLSQTSLAPRVRLATTSGNFSARPADFLVTLQTWPARLIALALLLIGVLWLDGRKAGRA